MHKLFIKNDWEIHDIYDYNYISQLCKVHKFQCKMGKQPNNEEDLEVYFSNRSASIDYTFVQSMSDFIFKIIKQSYRSKKEVQFINAIFTIASAEYEKILIADYPDKLVIRLPIIKEFKEYLYNYEYSEMAHSWDRVKIYYNSAEITMDTFASATNSDLYDIIITFSDILMQAFCKKTVIVKEDTFDIVEDTVMDMDICTTNISCRKVDTQLATGLIEIDAALVTTLKVANKVAGKFGGRTKYSCCGHSFEIFTGYILFEFDEIDRMEYFIDLLEKASDELILNDYFDIESCGHRLTIRVNDDIVFILAKNLDPEDVVKNIFSEFEEILSYIEEHRTASAEEVFLAELRANKMTVLD